MNLKPFFCFYGGKWRAAPRYPTPEHDIIIEPFAGAAGYSTRYSNRKVFLFEKDPVIANLWKFLINAKYDDIINLPLISLTHTQSVDQLDICDEAKTLIGFWLNKGSTSPCKTPSAWMREGLRPNSYWSTIIRERLAKQVESIKHWKVFNIGYENSSWFNPRATWFIDPPYQKAGSYYKHSSKNINFDYLAEYCKTRNGTKIVCENEGASWLPFTTFLKIKSNESSRGKSKSVEALWFSR